MLVAMDTVDRAQAPEQSEVEGVVAPVDTDPRPTNPLALLSWYHRHPEAE